MFRSECCSQNDRMNEVEWKKKRDIVQARVMWDIERNELMTPMCAMLVFVLFSTLSFFDLSSRFLGSLFRSSLSHMPSFYPSYVIRIYARWWDLCGHKQGATRWVGESDLHSATFSALVALPTRHMHFYQTLSSTSEPSEQVWWCHSSSERRVLLRCISRSHYYLTL